MGEKFKRLLVETLRRIELSNDLNQRSIRRIKNTEALIRKNFTDDIKPRTRMDS